MNGAVSVHRAATLGVFDLVIMRDSLGNTEQKPNRQMLRNMPTLSGKDLSFARLVALYGLLASLLVAGGCGSDKPAEDMTHLMHLVDFQRQFAGDDVDR